MDIIEPIDVDVKCTAKDVAVAARYFEDCRDFIVKYPPRAGS